MKKIVAVLVAALLTISFSSCSGQEETEKENSSGAQFAAGESSTALDESQEDDYSEPVTVTVAYDMCGNFEPKEDNLFDQMLKESFNMEWEMECIAQDAFASNLRLQMGANSYPDILFQCPGNVANELSLTGRLLNWDQFESEIPDYIQIFEDGVDGGWAWIKSMICASDGQIYYLPSKNPRATARCWYYREGTLENMGLIQDQSDLPTTVDDFIELMLEVKKADPESTPLFLDANQDFAGWSNAFNVQSSYYVDPFTDEFVPYGPVTDNWRQMLIALNKLYAVGVIDQDYLTLTTDQANANNTAGKYYAQFNWAGNRVNTLNSQTKQTDPDCNWVYSLDMLTSDVNREATFVNETPYNQSGPVLTDNLSGDKLSRLLDYFNWSATEEGSWFLSWGVEGETYSIDAEGKAQTLPQYASSQNPSGENLTLSLVYHQDFIPNRDIGAVINTSGKTNIELSNSFNEKGYKGYRSLNFVFDVDTQETVNMLYTIINDMRNEYSNQFVMGLLDPNSDSDWDKYVSDLMQSGLDKWSQYYVDYYNEHLS